MLISSSIEQKMNEKVSSKVQDLEIKNNRKREAVLGELCNLQTFG